MCVCMQIVGRKSICFHKHHIDVSVQFVVRPFLCKFFVVVAFFSSFSFVSFSSIHLVFGEIIGLPAAKWIFVFVNLLCIWYSTVCVLSLFSACICRFGHHISIFFSYLLFGCFTLSTSNILFLLEFPFYFNFLNLFMSVEDECMCASKVRCISLLFCIQFMNIEQWKEFVEKKPQMLSLWDSIFFMHMLCTL